MKILINNDISNMQNLFEKIGISVEKQEEETYILTMLEGSTIRKNIVSSDKISYYGDLFPSLNQYNLNNDTSLTDFITIKSLILATGVFEPVNKEAGVPYDYIANGDFRLYDSSLITTFNYMLSQQNDIYGYYDFLEKMLISSKVATAIKDENKKR